MRYSAGFRLSTRFHPPFLPLIALYIFPSISLALYQYRAAAPAKVLFPVHACRV